MRPHLLLLEVHVLQDRRAAGGVAADAAQIDRKPSTSSVGLATTNWTTSRPTTASIPVAEGAFGRRRGSSKRRVAPAAPSGPAADRGELHRQKLLVSTRQ